MSGLVMRPGSPMMMGHQGPPEMFMNGGGRPGFPQGGISVGPAINAAIETNGHHVKEEQNYSSDHIPLAKCRVLYLGSAVPLETAVGLESVQQPLRERYPYDKDGDVAGIDAWLTVYSSGIQMQYVADRSNNMWFPIQTLHVCAAVKCVVSINGATGDRTANFVALDSAGGKTSSHPPMFATVMRRTKGVKVLECHAFICKSNQAAMALVQSCTHAYEHKEGWTDDSPPPEVPRSADLHLVPAEKIDHGKASAEFYNHPPEQGYYYASRKDVVKNYNVFGNNTAPEPPQREIYRREILPPPPREPPPPMPPPQPRGRYVLGPLERQTIGYSVGPPIAMMVQAPPPRPAYIPVPPPGYFADWDSYGNKPVVVFPPPPPQEEIYAYRTRRRSPSPIPRGRSPERVFIRHRSPEPIYRSLSPRRRRTFSASPRRRYTEEIYGGSEIYDRRPRTPPIEYNTRYRSPPRRKEYIYEFYPDYHEPQDMILFADRYRPEPIYSRGRSPRREIYSSYRPREREYYDQRRINGRFDDLDNSLGYFP